MRIMFRGGWKEIALLIAAIGLFLIILALPLACAVGESIQPVRMHVVANSDSAKDQAVKHLVRKAILERYGSMLLEAGKTSPEALMESIHLHLPGMERTAREAAQQAGFAGSVRADAGWMHLPEKKDGTVFLPEGDYQALLITIGEGKGQNWWCVLYPRLSISLSQAEVFGSSPAFRWNAAEILRRWLLFGK